MCSPTLSPTQPRPVHGGSDCDVLAALADQVAWIDSNMPFSGPACSDRPHEWIYTVVDAGADGRVGYRSCSRCGCTMETSYDDMIEALHNAAS